MYPYGHPVGYMYDRNGVRGATMNSKPVKKRAIQAWREGDMANEYSVYQECLPMNGGWHMEHNDRPDGNRNMDGLITWSPSSVSECPSQTDSEVDSDINTSFLHSTPENIDASFYSDEKRKKRSKKKQLSVVLDRIGVNKAEKQKTSQEVVRIPGMGVASERKPSQEIQPIILDFEVPLPKESVKIKTNIEENCLKRIPSPSGSDEPSPKKQCNEQSADSTKETETMPPQKDQLKDSSQEEASQSDTSSKKPSTTEELFKKPDINQYKASTGGVRCFICQRQIITDGKETAFFGMVVCVPCKKIQESGGPALPTPVPKFPTSCHPKLFRGTKYVRSKYGRSSRSPSPGRSPSGSRSPGRSPASSPLPRSPMSPYRSNPVSPFSKPPSSPAMSPRHSVSATPPASPKGSAPQSRGSTPVSTTPPLETSSDKSPQTPTHVSMSPHHQDSQTHLSVSQPRVLGHPHPSPKSPSYHSPTPSPMSLASQSLPSSPLRINVSSSPERRSVPSPSQPKSDKFSPPHMTAMQMAAGMHRPPRVLSLVTPSSRPPHVELPNNETIPMSEVAMSSQASPPSSQSERTHQEHETIRALLKLRRQDQQHSISGPPPLIQSPASRGHPVGPPSQIPPGVVIPGVPVSPRSMYPASIPQGFIPSTAPAGYPRIQMMPLQRMPVEAFIPRSDAVKNHMLQSAVGNIRYSGIDPKSIPIPKIAEVRTLNPAMIPGMNNIPMLMQGYAANMSKRPRKKKNAMMPENIPTSQMPPGQYHGEKPPDQSGKEPLVIVGTNCGAGSSSIKVGNDKEPEPYMMPGQPAKAFQDGISRLLAFHCVCQGRTITFIQCPNCDFICNSIDGMELHFAAQRHAEIRGEPVPGNGGKYLVEGSEGSTKPDDVSLSSMETQSADTDSELSSPLPKNIQENWRLLNPSSDIRYEKHKHAYTSALDLRVEGSKPGEALERPTPLDLSQKQGLSIAVTRPQTSMENTIPLDLSGHIETVRLATREAGREAFGDASREIVRMNQQELYLPERYLKGPPQRSPAGLELIANKAYLTQQQLESEARARMVLVDNSPLYSISRGGKVPPTSYEYTTAGPGVMQLVRPPRSYPTPSTIPNRDMALFPGVDVSSRDIIRPPRPEEYRPVIPSPHLIQKEQQRINVQRSGSVTVQQLLRGGPPSQRTNQQAASNLQFHPGYPIQDGMGVSLPLPNLVRAQPRATVAPLVSQPCQISYQGGTISVHSTPQQLQQQQENLRDLQKRQREAFERQANLQNRHKEIVLERRGDLPDLREIQERERQIQERERQRDIQERERQRDIQEIERQRDIQELERQRDIQERERQRDLQERERQRDLQERERQRDLHERERQRDLHERERQHEIQVRERHRDMQQSDMQSRQRTILDRHTQEREANRKDSEMEIKDRQREVHKFHRGPKGKHRRIELQNSRLNQVDSRENIQENTPQDSFNNVSRLQSECETGKSTPTDNDSKGVMHVKAEPIEIVVDDEPTSLNEQIRENGQIPPVSENNSVEDSMMHLAEAEQYQVNAILKQESIQLATA